MVGDDNDIKLALKHSKPKRTERNHSIYNSMNEKEMVVGRRMRPSYSMKNGLGLVNNAQASFASFAKIKMAEQGQRSKKSFQQLLLTAKGI